MAAQFSLQHIQTQQSTPKERARPGDSGPRLQCHLGRHEPFARQANWTGEHYVSRCEHCSAPIRRVSSGKWVKDNRAIEYL